MAEPGNVVDAPERDAAPAAPPIPARWRVWRSPGDQPGWARPGLLGLTALAALAYGWGMAHHVPEIYYAAAVRSMAQSWHNFFFAAFDPNGTVSVDKLPGGLWPQALAVRVFGPRIWALMLPQVIEGALAIPVLYRAVRRLAGPVAGIVAAAVGTVTPAAIALNRGNISDSLMILLSVCAVNATVSALLTSRVRHLVLAGVWVGLAFQAKMVQAWLILPALGLAWLVAGCGRPRRRLAALVPAAAVAGGVSLSWMALVSLVPAVDRPAVDGSLRNSVFEQVFVYNAAGRVDALPAAGGTPRPGINPLVSVTVPGNSWLDRTVAGAGGRDAGWLLPLAVLAFVAVLVARRHADRTDPVRAGAVLWGGWLATSLVAFGLANDINAYYLAVLVPPIAAGIGLGTALLAPVLASGHGGGAVLALAAGTVGYGCWLLSPAGPVRFVALAVSLVALGGAGWLLLARRSPARQEQAGQEQAGQEQAGRGQPRRALSWAVALLLVAVLAAPCLAGGSLIADRLGPFDTPYQPASTTIVTHDEVEAVQRGAAQAMMLLDQVQGTARYPAATTSTLVAAPLIFYSGVEVLPIGGFTGQYPYPTLPELRALVATGQLRVVLVGPIDDPRITWVESHCLPLPAAPAAVATIDVRPYYCAGDAG